MSGSAPPAARPAIRPALILFLILLNAGALTVYFAGRHKASHRPAANGVPASLRLPDFSLTDSSGRPVTRADLEGRVWVADFIYTNCPSQCPLLTTKISALQSAVPPGVAFVSFSVDPSRDTPQALSAYAERFHADPSRWKFLTGERREIDKVLGALGAPAGPSLEAHSLRLYLIDREGRVAGLYDTGDGDALERLLRDSRELARP